MSLHVVIQNRVDIIAHMGFRKNEKYTDSV